MLLEFMTSISSLRIYLNVSSMLVLYEGWKSATRICGACRPESRLILRPKLSASRRDERNIFSLFIFFFLHLFFARTSHRWAYRASSSEVTVARFFSLVVFVGRLEHFDLFEREPIPKGCNLLILFGSHEENNEVRAIESKSHRRWLGVDAP